ncbi:hypothetical protein BOX15_Mlig023413g1 [Macrostomum lignano]|uniref:Innexin n=1 Tax=Macrostomum lignano TaxID=282301 RepID=A0A267FRT9_9PLAT|nr:hypothetical protein BOX15_Mlig006778g1 [Macrostomum lignano]PAA76480.1 hypothetical protein BOX15_Mlig023413g1 [Macrostomum lignano]
MVAADIFEKFRKFQQVTYTGVEDFSDRLNFQVTVVLLLACCTTVTLKTYVLSPVACYIPNEVGSHSGQEQYVNNYCWTEGTFAVPLSEFHIDNTLKDPIAKYEDRRIIYYQWVPFVLGLQSLLFYLPKVLWSMMSYNRAGTDVGHIIRAANDAVTSDSEKHAKLVQHVCKRLEQMLFQNEKLERSEHSGLSKLTLAQKLQRRIQRHFLLPSRRLGNWLIFIYFAMKLCYTANAIGQLYFMHAFLGFNSTYFAYGAAVFQNLRRGRDWTQTMVFPRVGACAVFYRLSSGGNFVFSQCTLPINMINEKIYVFLWFWVLGVAIVTVFSVPMWVWRLVQIRQRADFVKRYLQMTEAWDGPRGGVDKRDLHRFIRDFLRQDGTFLLRMIALNSGDVICSEVVQNLWSVYRRRRYGEPPAPEGVVCVPPEPEAEAEETEKRLLEQQQPPAPVAEFEKSPPALQRFVSHPASGGETRQRPSATTVTVEAAIGGARKKSATYEAPI